MTTVLENVGQFARRLGIGNPSTGWIGIDVGTRLIKLAQVQRSGQGWRIAGRWTIGDDNSPPLTADLLSTGALGRQQSSLHSVRRMFRGRLAAAALSSRFVEIRSLELPTGPWHETRAMIDQEISADASAELNDYEFDAWQAVPGETLTKVIAVAMNRDLSERVAADLLGAGFECAVIDAIPCAMARAVMMCDPAAEAEPVAALDVGDDAALLTVVHEGRPIFYRSFRHCGLQTLMQPLQDKLLINRQECRQLLTRYGIAVGDAGDLPVARTTNQVIGRTLEHLVAEVQRTTQFVSHQYRLKPKRMWLFGGGATVRNFAAYLARHTDLPTANWSLPGTGNFVEGSEPLYGVAAGLSALAWEAHGCT